MKTKLLKLKPIHLNSEAIVMGRVLKVIVTVVWGRDLKVIERGHDVIMMQYIGSRQADHLRFFS